MVLLTEVMAPLVIASQKQFDFTHIAAGATAFGKVGHLLKILIFN